MSQHRDTTQITDIRQTGSVLKAGLTLAHRLRCWANINPPLGQGVVLTVIPLDSHLLGNAREMLQ